MLHLLKQKSQVAWAQKTRRKYPVLKPQIGGQVQEDFNFSSALKELNRDGHEAYLKKHHPQPAAPMEIDTNKKKKGNQ